VPQLPKCAQGLPMSAGSRLSSALRSNAEVNQSATLVSRAKHVMRADASCHCALRPTACHWKANSHIRECSQATQCRLLQKSSAKRLLSTPRQRPRQRWEPRAQLIRFRAPVHTRAHREQHARMPEPTARPQPPARQRRSGRALTRLLAAARPDAPRPAAAPPSARNALARRWTGHKMTRCGRMLNGLLRNAARAPLGTLPARYRPAIFCICCSASLESSAKRMPTRAECFINFSQHLCTHCAPPAARAPLSVPPGRRRTAAPLHVRLNSTHTRTLPATRCWCTPGTQPRLYLTALAGRQAWRLQRPGTPSPPPIPGPSGGSCPRSPRSSAPRACCTCAGCARTGRLQPRRPAAAGARARAQDRRPRRLQKPPAGWPCLQQCAQGCDTARVGAACCHREARTPAHLSFTCISSIL